MGDTWISVKDRLPEESKIVLTYTHGYFDVLFYSVEATHFFHPSIKTKITHWMELPKPPEGK